MIAYLKGKLLTKTDESLVVENNDLGYEVRVPVPVWSKFAPGETVTLYTHEYIREDSRDLFGFASLAELSFFKKLISISGVGPKIALHVLSLGTIQEIQTAIASGNVTYLTTIPGIGQKTAQKIVIELKGKLDLTESAGDHESIDALQSLGYSAAQATAALRSVSPEITDVGDRVRATLKFLGKR